PPPHNTSPPAPAWLNVSSVAAIKMIAATALLMPSLKPEVEPGICLSLPTDLLPPLLGCGINALLIAFAIILAVIFNKKHSFVKSTEALLPTTMAVILASNPVNTSYLGTPIVMLIVNLLCLDIMMRSYAAENATTSMFAVATYLSLGSMVQYAFVPLMVIYPIMALMAKILRIKETVAYFMGLVAPYWVALGFGLISFSDFRMPQFLVDIPNADGNYLLMVFISLATLALVGLMMTLNNAMLIYAGNMRVRTSNNMINLLGFTCGVFMLLDFDNFGAYVSSFCFAVAVQISNFFAMRRIPQSPIWFWGLLSLFIAFFLFMLIESLIA
ncbi:MAG: hypothetical protein K2M16_08505, partial [Muribaculaceae bacterium]|nr:hypothetical protein [Muribaculaceae bacterium]